MNEHDKDQLRSRVAGELGLEGPYKVDLQVLPAMEVQLQLVTPERKARLAASIDEAFGARPDRKKVPETPTPLDDESVLAVCRTCAGSCCKSGEDHAYLTREVLTRVRREMKLPTDASLLEAYLERVPKLAHKGSCVFHGAQGCALPRAMRSETCNRYLCYPIKQLGRDFGRAGYAQVAVANVAGQPPAALVLSEGETQAFEVGE